MMGEERKRRDGGFRSPPVRDAATVIVARPAPEGPEVYLLRRSARSAFLPGYFVFPGGAVDAGDEAAAAELFAGAPPRDAALLVAAARETFEEMGLLFADRPVGADALAGARRALLGGQRSFAEALRALGVALAPRALRAFSRWITPAGEPRRFDTRFYVARAPDGQEAEADAVEVHDGRWVRPHDALHAARRGELRLIFPTIKHLERIAAFTTVDDLLRFAETKQIVTVAPSVDDERVFSIPPELDAAW